jgi:hypothetical protein
MRGEKKAPCGAVGRKRREVMALLHEIAAELKQSFTRQSMPFPAPSPAVPAGSRSVGSDTTAGPWPAGKPAAILSETAFHVRLRYQRGSSDDKGRLALGKDDRRNRPRSRQDRLAVCPDSDDR